MADELLTKIVEKLNDIGEQTKSTDQRLRGLEKQMNRYHLLSGYFEVASGGMQSTTKSYWSSQKGKSAQQAPNAISLNSKQLKKRFDEACDFINHKIDEIQNNNEVATTAAPSSADEVLKYKQLLDAGAITKEEFSAKKKQLLEL